MDGANKPGHHTTELFCIKDRLYGGLSGFVWEGQEAILVRQIAWSLLGSGSADLAQRGGQPMDGANNRGVAYQAPGQELAYLPGLAFVC